MIASTAQRKFGTHRLLSDFAGSLQKLEKGRERKVGEDNLASTFLTVLAAVLNLSLATELLQGGCKVRVGDGSRFGTVDGSRASGIEGSNGKTHGNPVIGMAINVSTD